MGNKQLEKAINLAKKIGGKTIIIDGNKEDGGFIVLSLSEYEKLLLESSSPRGLTEDELIDKINRDIAIWKSDNFENKDKELFFPPLNQNSFKNKNEKASIENNPNSRDERDEAEDDENFYYYNEDKIGEDNFDNFNKDKGFFSDKSKAWSIPPKIKKKAQEII